MTNAWYIGFAVGVLLAVVLIVLIKKLLGKKCTYDERQIAARGQAFKTGFCTFVICELIVFFIEFFREKPLVLFQPGMLSIVICLTALLVFLEVAIFKDAYFSPDHPFSKKWCALMFFSATIYIAQFLVAKEKWYALLNLVVGVFIVIVMLSILVKKAISRKSEDEDVCQET